MASKQAETKRLREILLELIQEDQEGKELDELDHLIRRLIRRLEGLSIKEGNKYLASKFIEKLKLVAAHVKKLEQEVEDGKLLRGLNVFDAIWDAEIDFPDEYYDFEEEDLDTIEEGLYDIGNWLFRFSQAQISKGLLGLGKKVNELLVR